MKPLRIFEVEFYDTTKRIVFAENRQEIWKNLLVTFTKFTEFVWCNYFLTGENYDCC